MSGRNAMICGVMLAMLTGAAVARGAGPIGIGADPDTIPPEFSPQIGINPDATGSNQSSQRGDSENSALLNTGAATAPASKWAVGQPVGEMMSAIAVKFGAILVMPKTSAVVLKAGELPKTLEDAVGAARDNLEPQGLGLIESVTGKPDPRVVLRVTPLKEAKDAEEQVGPVTSGADASAISVKNPSQQVTHLMPVNHADMLETLEHKAREDPSVDVDVVNSAQGSQTLIFRGPAAKVKLAVTAVSALDKPEDLTPAVRQLKLSHLDAVGAAATLNADFGRSGRSQLRAVADRRTNMVIISGPEDQVVDAMVTLVEMDLGTQVGAKADVGQAPATGTGASPGQGGGSGR